MSQEPGWYYAAGDPPGTQRYWDGELWQGDPQAVAPAPAAAGHGAGYTAYPESSQATTALVLAIVGLVICGLLGPIAWNIGQKELDAIDAGRRDPSNRGTAKAGKIIGMIVTALLVLGILGFAVIIVAR